MLKPLLTKVTRITEFIAAMALAAIFIIFLIQIFSRYAPQYRMACTFQLYI